MPEPRRGWGRALGSALLNIAALGGLACILLVLLSVVLHISLIMFKTGSMSPTIPAGSLAVVREIPASEISVGDVLTVDRAGALPVTHRVTSVTGEGEIRTITMKGDANVSEDPAPYTVAEARRVLFAIPGLARVVVWFSDPWVLGSLTLAASALVTWAFWPRNPRPAPRGAVRGSGGEDGAPARGRHGAGARIGTGAAVVAVGLALAVVPAPRAEAQPGGAVEQVVHGEHITLTSIGDPGEMRAMRAGVPVHWQVGVRIDEPGASAVEIELAAEGSAELGLRLGVRSCSERWIGTNCGGSETAAVSAGPADLGSGFEPLVLLRDEAERWILVTAEIPAPASGTVALTLRATGSGDDLEVGRGGVAALPPTGAGGDLGWAALLALGAVVAGLVAARIARCASGERS